VSKEGIDLGRLAEDSAADFLKTNGYKIIRRNYRNKLGEVDIIAKDKDTICFVEVKYRSSDKFGLPSEAVSALKQRRISKVALSFLKDKGLLEERARFDVITVSQDDKANKIELIKNAFELGGGSNI